jgi:hypothetical protein
MARLLAREASYKYNGSRSMTAVVTSRSRDNNSHHLMVHKKESFGLSAGLALAASVNKTSPGRTYVRAVRRTTVQK